MQQSPSPAPVPSRPTRWHPVHVALAVASVVVLLGSLVISAALVTGEEDPLAAHRSTSPDQQQDRDDDVALEPAPWTQDPDPDLDLPDVWDDRVVELAAFVEEERGMDFVFPVHVDFLTEDEFADALSLDDDIDTEQEEALEEMRESMSMFRALGWMEGGGDLVEMVDDYAGAITAAFYDAEERRITVPTTDPSGLDDLTIVHELTHALQDQYFDLNSLRASDDEEPEGGDTPDPDDTGTSDTDTAEPEAGDEGPGSDEATTDEDATAEDTTDEDEERHAFATPVVEGDAMRIERVYLDSLPIGEQQDLIDESRGTMEEVEAAVEDFPSFFEASFYAPYRLGQPLVGLVAALGGNAEVDAMFADLPDTGLHLTAPLTYIDDQPPGELPPPDSPGGDVMEEDEFDALDLYYLLAQGVELDRALEASDSWHAGRFVTYRENDRVCVRVALAGDGPDGTALVADALEDWVEVAPDEADATILDRSDDQVELESCDPGPVAELEEDRLDEALELVAFRASLAWELTEFMGAMVDDAWSRAECITQALLDDDFDFTDAMSEDQADAVVDAMLRC